MGLQVSSAFANFAARDIYAPVNNSTITGTSVQFIWEGGPSGADWWLQVSDNPYFTPVSSIILNTATTVYYYNDPRCISPFSSGPTHYCSQISTAYSIPPNSTAHSKQLYWHVAGTSDGYFTNDNWSPVGGFLQAPSLPATPGLSSPINDAYIKGSTVTFNWATASNVTNYYLEVYNKNNVLIFGNWVGNASSYTPAVTFADDGGRCYWRIKAKNDGGESSFSAYGYFVNGKAPIAVAPVLSAPSNRTFLAADGGNITFQWAQVTNAESYDLQISTEPDFSTTFTNTPSSTNSLTVAKSSLNVMKKYYWRVRAVNYHGEGDFSETRQLIVGANAECWPETGSGIGFSGAQGHIDTCFDTGTNSYQLKDISRRLNMNIDQHSSRMADSAAITTRLYTAIDPLTDADNVWNDAGQKSAVDAHVNSAHVYDYFSTELKLDASSAGRNSYDDLGSTMLSAVEVMQHSDGRPCINNSYWYDSKVNICKSSVGVSPSSASLDVVAHEWGHGLTEKASGLVYLNESGALDEAFADWIGVAVEVTKGKGLNWTIGEDTVTVRDLQNPKLYQQPDYYKDPDPDGYWFDYIVSGNDYGGVHTNSGVPNKMFYLLAAGGTHPNPRSRITVQKIPLERAIRIAYRANAMKYWSVDAKFSDARIGMSRAAEDLYEANSNEVYQVQNAWAAVGVGELPKIATSTDPPNAGVTLAYLKGAKLLSCPTPPDTNACIDASRYKSSCCTYETYYSPFGKNVTVEATANPGYYFKNWTVNGNIVSSSPTYTFTATADSSPVANFTTSPPAISAATPLGDFLAVSAGSTSPEHVFTVVNAGSQTMTIASIDLGGDNPTEFNITYNGCNGSLSPAASCTVKANFAPTSAGAKTASLAILSNDTTSSSYVIALSGLAGLPVMTNSPGGLNVLNHSAIQTAYNSIADGNEIKLWATDFNETLNCNRPVTTTIRGGFDGGFADRIGKTALQGTMTISSGKVIVDGLQIGGTSTVSTVAVRKSGSGTVAIAPAGLSCGSDCSSSFMNGTDVTLTAVPDSYASFTGWSGGNCSGTAATCTFTLTADTTVTASFTAPASPAITATPMVASFGTLYAGSVSQPLTITVTSYGTQDLVIGDLSLSGSNSAEFVMTANSCSGLTLAPSASCAVQVSFAPTSTGAKSANLAIPSNDPTRPALNISLDGIGLDLTLSVAKSGTGSGTVASSPAGISCGTTCSAPFLFGTALTLTPTADPGSIFTGWSGGLCAGTLPCGFDLYDDMATTATFALLPTADFGVTLSSGSAPATATFTDSSLNTSSWFWDFGDGVTSTLRNPAHTYRNPGSYTASLTASNAYGPDTKNVIIAMDPCGLPARIGGSYHATIQAAYDAAANGDTVQVLALDFTEDLYAGQGKYVILDGGYLCGFATNPDTTVLHGAPRISAGTVKLRNMRIAQ